jgi:diguanylate cyclase (GGDEF)-like protein
MLFVLALAWAAAAASPAQASAPWASLADPVFVRVDSSALPEAAAMSLAQDAAGFLWIGTQGGVARYDGYRFTSFLPNPSDPNALPDGYIRSLLSDDRGGMWIGPSTSGLVHFDPTTEMFRTWRPDPAGHNGPRSAEIDALARAGNGELWVGGDGGLDRFDPQANRFEHVPLVEGEQPVVWSVFVDRAGGLWAGTQHGLYYRAAQSPRFVAFDAHITSPIYCLFEDSASRVWAGATNVAYVVDASRRRARALRSVPRDAATLAPGQQWTIAEVTPGKVWFGTDNAISIVDPATLRVHRVVADPQNPGGLTAGRAQQFLMDRSGMVWLANHVGGLLLYNPNAQHFYELSTTRPEIGFGTAGAVAVAVARDGRLWIGGFGGALLGLASSPNRTTSLTLPNRAAVQTIVEGNGGRLWIGTTAGLCSLDPPANAQCPAGPHEVGDESVYSILTDGPQLIVGGSNGLVISDSSTGAVRVYRQGRSPRSLSNSAVRALLRDRRGRLWIGTENGLNRLDADGRVLRFAFSRENSNTIGPGGIATLMEDRRGRIWAGANGGPMSVLRELPNGKYRIVRVGRESGMPHENVDGLAEDKHGRIWASTDKGIALIDPDTLHARALGLADGVSQNAYWAGTQSQAADGTIFFGGLDGVTAIGPDAASPWSYAPAVVASALQIGRKSAPAAELNSGFATIELPAGERDITVEFAALDYSAPQSLRYAYKLDGYDRDWIDADSTHRIATYRHLPPGAFTLEIRGTNRLGVWSAHALRVNVRPLPAWYETWWFRAFIAALILLLGYGLHRLRTAVLRRRQRELELLVDDRTAELSQVNARLEEMSVSDPLTGLRNRRFLAGHLEADVHLALRNGTDLLFFVIDLDKFKSINDEYGHNAGDSVLMEMRERLHEVFRESDFVVRWGGDEFLAIARDTDRDDAGEIAERIRVAIARRPFSLGTGELSATVSIGFAAFPFVKSAPNAVGWARVVDLADQALYLAKRAGRNTWFGLAASADTDPAILAHDLAVSPEEAVRAGALEVLSAERVSR